MSTEWGIPAATSAPSVIYLPGAKGDAIRRRSVSFLSRSLIRPSGTSKPIPIPSKTCHVGEEHQAYSPGFLTSDWGEREGLACSNFAARYWGSTRLGVDQQSNCSRGNVFYDQSTERVYSILCDWTGDQTSRGLEAAHAIHRSITSCLVGGEYSFHELTPEKAIKKHLSSLVYQCLQVRDGEWADSTLSLTIATKTRDGKVRLAAVNIGDGVIAVYKKATGMFELLCQANSQARGELPISVTTIEKEDLVLTASLGAIQGISTLDKSLLKADKVWTLKGIIRNTALDREGPSKTLERLESPTVLTPQKVVSRTAKAISIGTQSYVKVQQQIANYRKRLSEQEAERKSLLEGLSQGIAFAEKEREEGYFNFRFFSKALPLEPSKEERPLKFARSAKEQRRLKALKKAVEVDKELKSVVYSIMTQTKYLLSNGELGRSYPLIKKIPSMKMRERIFMRDIMEMDQETIGKALDTSIKFDHDSAIEVGESSRVKKKDVPLLKKRVVIEKRVEQARDHIALLKEEGEMTLERYEEALAYCFMFEKLMNSMSKEEQELFKGLQANLARSLNLEQRIFKLERILKHTGVELGDLLIQAYQFPEEEE
jgi:hypothetical protein